ncbi:MAG: aldo/keto reductase [Bacteroidetes bacterium]|nr:aldo/keto reductase [Bacteroidota bacterium]
MSIDKIILGTVQLGLSYGINSTGKILSEQEAIQILQQAKSAGIKVLDTAKAYGNAMNIIGLYHKEGQVFEVISKFHIHENFGFIVEYKNDLKALNISKMYALLFHDFLDYQNNAEYFKKLKQLKEENLLEKIGVSVYTNDEFAKVIDDENVDLIQLPFNLLDNYNLRGELLKKAKQKNKEIHVRSIFLQGLFYKDVDQVPEKLKSLKPYLTKIKSIADDFNISVSELAFMYALQQKEIDKVVFGVDNLSQLNLNIELIKKLPSFSVTERVNKEISVKDVQLLNPYNWRTKTALITQARTGSSRLPGKVLKKVNGETLLDIHLKRLAKCKTIDHFVVATTVKDTDVAIEKIALEKGWNCFRGSESNVLERFYKSLPENEYDYVVRVTSDCPLVDAEIVDELVKYTIENKLDYCTNSLSHQYPDGVDVEVFTYKALQYSWQNAIDKLDKEHVTLFMTRHSNLEGGKIFNGADYPSNLNMGDFRVTVDEQSDFDLVEKLILKLGSDKNWKEYIAVLQQDKALAEINKGIVRNVGYLKALEEEEKKKLNK